MVAVQRFRDVLDQRRLDGADGSSAVESSDGRVVGTTVQPLHGAAGDIIKYGDDIRVVATLESAAGIDEWICAIQIDNSLGQKVFGTSTDRLDLKLPPLHGRIEIEFILKSSALGAGKYFVNTSLMDFVGRHLHDLSQATSFNTANDDRTTGMLLMPVEATITTETTG
jgi:ABC-2 type transport system ATP-binding protein